MANALRRYNLRLFFPSSHFCLFGPRRLHGIPRRGLDVGGFQYTHGRGMLAAFTIWQGRSQPFPRRQSKDSKVMESHRQSKPSDLFNEAVKSARQVDIYWCPLILPGSPLYAELKPADRHKLTSMQAITELWSTEDGIASVPKNLRDACAKLTREADQSALVSRLAEIGSVISRSMPRRSDDTTIRVAHAAKALAGDEAMGQLARELLWNDNIVKSNSLSLGVFEEYDGEFSPRERRWMPEVNVVAQYDARTLQRTLVAAGTDLCQYLKWFCRRMVQNAVFVVVDGSAWLVRHDGIVEPKGAVRVWGVNAANQYSAADKAVSFYENLQRQLKWLDAEVVMCPKGHGHLGATFLWRLDDQSDAPLEIRVAGHSCFLFKACFPPILADASDDDPADVAGAPNTTDLILLDAQLRANNGDRGVLYAAYQEPQNNEQRCLCGSRYPDHEASKEVAVVPLRSAAREWIEERYRSGERGGGIASWRLLSSPHFYFAAEGRCHVLLVRTEDSEKAHKEAIGNAKRKWNELMMDGGPLCTQVSPVPTDGV
jgi:hypothetical protein